MILPHVQLNPDQLRERYRIVTATSLQAAYWRIAVRRFPSRWDRWSLCCIPSRDRTRGRRRPRLPPTRPAQLSRSFCRIRTPLPSCWHAAARVWHLKKIGCEVWIKIQCDAWNKTGCDVWKNIGCDAWKKSSVTSGKKRRLANVFFSLSTSFAKDDDRPLWANLVREPTQRHASVACWRPVPGNIPFVISANYLTFARSSFLKFQR